MFFKVGIALNALTLVVLVALVLTDFAPLKALVGVR